MKVEEIIKRSTIDFQRLLNTGEAEALLEHISNDMRADINYNVQFRKHILQRGTEKGMKYKGSSEIGGMISLVKEPGFDAFRLIPAEERVDNPEDYEPHFNGLEFIRAPGFDFDDYDPSTVQLWSRTRESIEKYLNNN